MTGRASRKGHTISAPGGKIVIAEKVDQININGKSYPRPAEYLRYRTVQFIGRKDYIDRLIPLLKQSRTIGLYAIKGMGGIGKTVLAAELAYYLDQEKHYPGGVLWADLGSYTAGEIAAQWLENFGYDVSGLDENTRLKRLSSLLADLNALLILDNAKNLADVNKLLVKDINIPIIITTRNQKTIPLGVQSINLDQMSPEDSIELIKSFTSAQFIEENLQEVNEICYLCGYLPLALAIAGSQIQDNTKWPSLEIYRKRLSARRMELLSTGDDYSNNVFISFDISYQDLDQMHKDAFDIIALFDGPTFSQEAVTQILDLDNNQVEKILDRLVELSLVIRIGGRFRVHDLIREYSIQKINQRESLIINTWKKRFTIYYSTFTSNFTTNYPALDVERINVLRISNFDVDDTDWAKAFVTITRNLTEYLKVRGLWNEAYLLGEKAFDLAQKASLLEAQAELATRNLSWVCYFHGNLDRAKYWANMGLGLFDRLGLELESAYAARRFAMTLIEVGEYSDAQIMLEGALKSFEKFEKMNKVGDTLTVLGYLQRKLCDYDQAEKLLYNALDIVTKIDDKKEISMALYNLARLRTVQGRKEQALELHRQSLEIDESLSRKPGIAWNLLRIGQLEYELKETKTAIHQLEKARLLFGEMGVEKYNELIDSLLSRHKKTELSNQEINHGKQH